MIGLGFYASDHQLAMIQKRLPDEGPTNVEVYPLFQGGSSHRLHQSLLWQTLRPEDEDNVQPKPKLGLEGGTLRSFLTGNY